MATPRLFKLKAEIALAPSGPLSERSPFAKVWVNTGVFHLDQMYEYKIPEKFSTLVQLGVRVQVPFGSQEVEGIVLGRSNTAERATGLKNISKVISQQAVATDKSIAVIAQAAIEFGCNPWDLIRSAIPPRVASVEKELTLTVSDDQSTTKGRLGFVSFGPFVPPQNQLRLIIEQSLHLGSQLIVAPDEKDVDELISSLNELDIPLLKLTSAMARSQRYLNFLLSMRGKNVVVVGTRSAVFAPVNNLAKIIIYKESSPEHYEIRSPGWNTKEIALLRNRIEGVDVLFTGYAPSLNCSYLIEKRKISFLGAKAEVKVRAYEPSDGALLPGRIFAPIRKEVLQGPVLFLAPRKGYGNALMCGHCKNIALCDCGGRLIVTGKNVAASCVHCAKVFAQWSCNFCGKSQQYLGGRGIERAAEEISRAFPSFPVIVSSSNSMKEQIERKPSLVLSTAGSVPKVDGGYSAVVILDGLRFFSHTDFRSQERARELFFETASYVSPLGVVLIVIDPSHPIIWSLTKWSSVPFIKRELMQLEELSLPPFVSSILMGMDESDAVTTLNGLRKAQQDGRLPQEISFFGPTLMEKGQMKIVIHAPHERQSSVVSFIHELSRRRSIANKAPLLIRVNPYSL